MAGRFCLQYSSIPGNSGSMIVTYDELKINPTASGQVSKGWSAVYSMLELSYKIDFSMSTMFFVLLSEFFIDRKTGHSKLVKVKALAPMIEKETFQFFI